MLFDRQTKEVFEMPWGWDRVDKTQEIIIPKLKVLADKMERLIAEIYGSDTLRNYGHKSVPSSASGVSGYTGKVRRSKPFDESKNNLSDIGVGITPNAKGTKVLRANIDKVANLINYDKVYGELCLDITEMRGDATIGIRFGVASYARVKYHRSVYKTYADNVEKFQLNKLISEVWEEDTFCLAHLPKSSNLLSCDSEDIEGIINPQIFRSGFTFLMFGERYLFEESLGLDDYADLILRGAAIFPLLDIFVRQVSDKPVDEIDYQTLFKNWCQNSSSLFFQQFDLTSDLNGDESKGERITRELLERIFGKPFIKERPKWLKETSRSRTLELDGYNEELDIAFEYQGEQHYFFIPLFHGDIASFEKQLERDKLKAAICLQRGVRLIQVPYAKSGDRQFIIDELQRMGVSL